jgi:hypothetical protein
MWVDVDGTFHFDTPSNKLSDYKITSDVEYSNPKVELAKPLLRVDVVLHHDGHPSTTTVQKVVGTSGDVITVDCPLLLNSTNRANEIATKYADWWKYREIISGEFRADPRLQLFDVVTVDSKYGKIAPVMITYLKYTYNGSFHGTYEGQVIGEIVFDDDTGGGSGFDPDFEWPEIGDGSNIPDDWSAREG